MDFICSGCGSCCKRIGLVKDKFKELNFPYQVNEKGWCEMLGEDNKCKVYENRPEICNMKTMFHKYFENKGFNEKEIYLENTKLCNKYITEDRLDKKYILNENIYK